MPLLLQSDINAVLRWSSDTLLEAARDALQRSQGQAGVSDITRGGAWWELQP